MRYISYLLSLLLAFSYFSFADEESERAPEGSDEVSEDIVEDSVNEEAEEEEDPTIEEFIEDAGPINTFKKVELYFGNIDIRHHLCRVEGNHIDNAIELASRYIQAAEKLPIDDVSIYELLPIEDESRKLPKSGYYKGKPFWGTWEQRNSARMAFYETLKTKAKRVKVIKWTDYLLNRDGQLDFKIYYLGNMYWSNGVTSLNNLIIPTVSSDYIVYLDYVNGCTSTDTVQVVVSDLQYTSQSTSVSCIGLHDGLIDLDFRFNAIR